MNEKNPYIRAIERKNGIKRGSGRIWGPAPKYPCDECLKGGLVVSCAGCRRNRSNIWNKNNREHVRQYQNAWNRNNPEKYRAKVNKQNIKIKTPSFQLKHRAYMEKNQDWIRERQRPYSREYYRNRRHADPRFKLTANARHAVSASLRGVKAYRNWSKLVGYTADELMAHLEKQFDPQMNWENYGSYWHIDHIKPIASFDYTTAEDPQFLECWSLKNLQPLEAKENIRKGKKLNYEKVA